MFERREAGLPTLVASLAGAIRFVLFAPRGVPRSVLPAVQRFLPAAIGGLLRIDEFLELCRLLVLSRREILDCGSERFKRRLVSTSGAASHDAPQERLRHETPRARERSGRARR